MSSRDTGSIVLAAMFIIVAAVAIWDTTTMVDSDSYVFPRAIAGSMIVFCLLLIIWNFIRPTRTGNTQDTDPQASSARRIGLVIIMLLGALLMPYLGFIVAGIIIFIAIMLVAMHEPWTLGRVFVYPLVGIGVVLGFYALFTKVLLVPLPAGQLWS